MTSLRSAGGDPVVADLRRDGAVILDDFLDAEIADAVIIGGYKIITRDAPTKEDGSPLEDVGKVLKTLFRGWRSGPPEFFVSDNMLVQSNFLGRVFR